MQSWKAHSVRPRFNEESKIVADLKPLLLSACLWIACWEPAFADGSVVGMVLDLQGPVQATENGTSARLRLLTSLKPQARIQVPAGSKASVTIYSTRSVYRLEGPTVVLAAHDGLTVLQGKAPEIRAMGEQRVAAAQAAHLVPGAYRMRSLRTEAAATSPANVPNHDLLALQPAESDAIEDWVLYAALLQQHRLRDEARDVWKRIATRRPDLARSAEQGN